MDYKVIFSLLGGGAGWIVAEFRPTFPLIIVMVVFVMYDAYTAFRLDKRAHRVYPEETKRHEAKFTSFAFGKVIRETIPRRLMLVLLAYLVEHWVCLHVELPLSYIVTGAICFEQAWSILENEASCRPEKEGRFFRLLKKIVVDKTARHFDVEIKDIQDEEDN